MNQLTAESIALLEAACNGSLTQAQFEELERLLDTDEQFRLAYVRYMSLDADLWRGGVSATAERQLPESQSSVTVANASPPSFRTRLVGTNASVLAAGLLVSLSILLSVWLFRSESSADRSVPAPTPVAFLTRTVDASWQEGGLHSGCALLPGEELELTDGLAEITFDSGARIILQGPTTLELISAQATRLLAGRLVVRTTLESSGLMVRTPSTTLVDMGAEFGLHVDEQGESEIAVLAGEVDVERPPEEPRETAAVMPESFRLTKGQQARIAVDRVEMDRPVEVSEFVRNDRLTELTRSVVLEDAFAEAAIDPVRWQIATHARNSSVRSVDGAAELTNRGYLVTTDAFNPLSLGGIRITGRWRCVVPDGATDNKRVNIMTIALRADPGPTEGAFDISSGIRCICYTSSCTASIASRGDALETTKPRIHSTVGSDAFEDYRFEIVDDGKYISFKFWQADDPQNAAYSTAAITQDTSDQDHIIFYCREAQSGGWDYRVLLDDVAIETGIGPIAE